MSFMDVMYGPLGQVNNQFQANLGQNAAMNQGNQYAAQQQQAAMAAQQAQLAALYGSQGFGGQTAAYAGAGAAYGRETGGFGGSVFDTGTSPYNTYGQPGVNAGAGTYGDPYGGGSTSGGSWVSDVMGNMGWQPNGSQPQASSFDSRFSASPPVDYNLQGSPAPIPRGILTGNFNTQTPNAPSASFNERFGIFGDPTQGMNYTASNPYGGYADPAPSSSTQWTFDDYGNPVPRGYGSTGVDMYSPSAYAPTPQAQDPRLYSGNFFGANNGTGIGQGAGMAPGYGGFNNPAYDPTNFAGRFGAGGYFGAGSPSQYATQPYTSAQGNTYQPGQLPGGFTPAFSVDQPQGAPTSWSFDDQGRPVPHY